MQSALVKLFPGGTFSSERINTGRQIEFDLLKAIAILVMVIDHSVLEISDYYNLEETLYDVIIGGYVMQLLNASLFMISMGLSVNYSRHQGAKSLALRGVVLLSTGQLLTLLRDVFPNLIGYALSGNRFFLTHSALVWSVDIMQLAGLSFLLFGLLKRLGAKGPGIFLTACGLNVLGMLLNGTETDSYLVNQLLGYFYPTQTESYFPLFNWFIYPAFGVMFGEVYLHVQDKDRLYNRIFALCLPIAAVYFVLRYTCDFLHFGDLTRLVMLTSVILPDALGTILLDLAVFGLLYKIGKLFKNGELPKPISFLAKHLNKYYCISWVIIAFTHIILLLTMGGLLKNSFTAYFAAVLNLAVCTLIILFYERYLKKVFSKIPTSVILALFAGVWVFSIAYSAWLFPQLTEYPNYLNDYLYDQLGSIF